MKGINFLLIQLYIGVLRFVCRYAHILSGLKFRSRLFRAMDLCPKPFCRRWAGSQLGEP